MYLHSKLVVAALTIILFGSGAFIGYYFTASPDTSSDELRQETGNYVFINPLLDYQQSSNPLLRREVRQMEDEITTLIENEVALGTIKEASLYYRDLNNGPTLFVGQDVFFTPASLLKVPIMIAYFKMAESDPEVLNRVINYDQPLSEVPSQSLITLQPEIQPGKAYTVLELIEKMITHSDNTAALLLQQYIDPDIQKNIYDDFDIPLPNTEDPRKPYMTTQVYSGFLRILYNATYLNRTYSEKALEILSRSLYNEGIRAGMPKTVKVSNKFGVFAKSIPDNIEIQLHDCGIVYDKKTYIICVMTSGHNLEAQSTLIKSISEIIYKNNQK